MNIELCFDFLEFVALNLCSVASGIGCCGVCVEVSDLLKLKS